MGEISKPFLIFIATTAISFAGSIQLGMVNLTVIQSVLRRNLKEGLWVALGGSLPEMLYATAAIWAGMWLEKHQSVWNVLEWSAVPVLLGIGIVTFQTPNRSIDIERQTNQSFSWAKGFIMGLLNPQLFPYWLLMLVQFTNYDVLRVQTLPDRIAFIIGTAVGALVLLVILAYLTHRFKDWLLHKMKKGNTNRFLGILFMLLALGQLVKLWIKS